MATSIDDGPFLYHLPRHGELRPAAHGGDQDVRLTGYPEEVPGLGVADRDRGVLREEEVEERLPHQRAPVDYHGARARRSGSCSGGGAPSPPWGCRGSGWPGRRTGGPCSAEVRPSTSFVGEIRSIISPAVQVLRKGELEQYPVDRRVGVQPVDEVGDVRPPLAKPGRVWFSDVIPISSAALCLLAR